MKARGRFIERELKIKFVDVYLYSFDGIELKKTFGCLRIYNNSGKTTFRSKNIDGSINERDTKIVSSEEGKVYSRFVWFENENSDDKAIKLFIEKYKDEYNNILKKAEVYSKGIENLQKINKKEV